MPYIGHHVEYPVVIGAVMQGAAWLVHSTADAFTRGLQFFDVTVAVLAVFLVKPDGILALPLHSAPIVLAAYAVAAGAAWRARRRRSADRSRGRVRGLPGGEQPALTNS